MSIPSFYEPTLHAGVTQFTLSESSSKHCVQVLRMQISDILHLTNGAGDQFTASIQVAHKKETVVQINAHQFVKPSEQKMVLGISLLKNAVRLEWLLEKATEMGVHTIVPLICERTIHARFKMDRMQNILQSAMIQSQQAWLPQLVTPCTFAECLKQYQAADKFIAHCEPSDKKSIKELTPSNDCILLIGPEGDFTPDEIAQSIQHNYQAIHLGPTRLRTETAGIFALSVLKKF
jgi:16S rRNA (uracil1498-N3)-methyltransferase